MSGDAIVVSVQRSKTDQVVKGAKLTLDPCSDEICPVDALLVYMNLRGGWPGYIFCYADGSPLTKHHFWSITSRALERIVFAGVKFGHIFST